MVLLHVLRIENIHCSSCEAGIRDTLTALYPDAPVSIDRDAGLVSVTTGQFDANTVLAKLHKKGFEVSAIDEQPTSKKRVSWQTRLVYGNKADQNFSKNHLAVCSKCKSSVANLSQQGLFRVTLSISGMSCSNCKKSIEAQVKESVPQIVEFGVDLMTQSAHALVDDKLLATKIQNAVRDSGYKCTITEIIPVSSENVVRVVASIGGMTCGSCSNAVQIAVKELPFVKSANVDVLSASGEFIIDSLEHVKDVQRTVEDVGYTFMLLSAENTHRSELHRQTREITIQISGIHCERCPEKVMNVLNNCGEAIEILTGPTSDHPFVKFRYVPDAPRFTIRVILSRLIELAPELEFAIVKAKSLEELAAENLAAQAREILSRLALTALLAVPAAVAMFYTLHSEYLMLCLATPTYFLCDDIFHKHAIQELRSIRKQKSWNRRLLHFGTMNLLVSLGTSISYWASIFVLLFDPASETFFDSVIFLTFFLLIGRYLDVHSKMKTSSAVTNITSLRPDSVELVTPDGNEVQPIESIEVNDTVLVAPGSNSAVDGIVIQGMSEFDESMLNGESRPVLKQPGDQVFAGIVNIGDSAVVVRVTAVQEGTLLESIAETVRQGQCAGAPIERIAEQITSVFVPIVVYLALAVWVMWYALGKLGYLPESYLEGRKGGWGLWSMEFAISTFVVACPCGIGLAAPTALYIGTGMAAKYGILARGGGEAFQEVPKLDVVCFDKTGTLTQGGELTVTDEWFSNDSNLVETEPQNKDELRQLAARLESESTHPLGKAIGKHAGDIVFESRVEAIRNIPGRGLGAQATAGPYKDKSVLLGNERLLLENQIEISHEATDVLKKWKSEGKSVALLAVDKQLCMMLALSDNIRPEASVVIQSLQARNIECWMITGDNIQTAKAIALQVSIPEDKVIAEILPEEKADSVRYLQQTGNSHKRHTGRAVVAMVGDGINDAPSLAVSDVGIALASGSDVALTSSKFVLLTSDLSRILVLVDLSKAVVRRIQFNFFWAVIYNMFAIPVAAGALYPYIGRRLDPVWASVAMALSSVSVVGSSFLLKRFRPSKVWSQHPF